MNAILFVSHPNFMFERIGGVTVLERQLFTAKRAGIERIWINGQKPNERVLASLRFPQELRLSWSSQEETARQCRPPYFVISGDYFIRVAALREILAKPLPIHTAYTGSKGSPVVEIVPFAADRNPTRKTQPMPDGSIAAISLDRANKKVLVDWLLLLGPKPQDGFMARNFDRHISLAVSRRLLDTSVTPNRMTVLSSLIGLCGAALFLRPSYGARLAGSLFIWLHSVLDGCDGELARVRFQESAFGSDLDFWGDNLVHLALFGCLGIGFYRVNLRFFPLILGLAACLGSFGSAWLAYKKRVAQRQRPAATQDPVLETTAAKTLSRLEDSLAARDFIYLLVILAGLSWTYQFLWAAAVGSPIFYFMTRYLGRIKNEQTKQPHLAGDGEVGGAAARNGSGHQHIHSGR